MGSDSGVVSDTHASGQQRKLPQKGDSGCGGEEASCLDPDKPRSEARAWGGGGRVPVGVLWRGILVEASCSSWGLFGA